MLARVATISFAIALLAGAIIAGYRVLWSDPQTLAAAIQDDSFYYLLPAWNAAANGGILTFDGEHRTFGVQPAFAALLTALATLCPDRAAFLQVSLLLAEALYLLTAVGLWAVVRQWLRHEAGAERAAAAGAGAGLAWLANLPVLFGHTTLKENALHALIWVLGLGLATGARPRPWQLGLVLGVGLATRLSPASALVSVAIWWWHAHHAPRRLTTAISSAIGTLLGFLPFAAYGLWLVGRALPTSGAVKLAPFRAALTDGSLGDRLRQALSELPGYLGDCIQYALGMPHGFTVPQIPAPPHFAGWPLAIAASAGVLALARMPGTRSRLRLLLMLLVAALVGKAVSMLLLRPFGDLRYFQWYVTATPVLAALLAGSGLVWLPTRVLALMLPAMALLIVVQAALARPPIPTFAENPHSWPHQMQAAAVAMNRLLPPHARVGAANTGGLGYFARNDLVVINLDGLANDDWWDRSRQGMSLLDYLDHERIDYLADVLTPRPFGRHLLATTEPVDVLPYRGPDFDGYFLVRRRDVPFPQCWPEHGPYSGKPGPVCVPWHDGDPLAAAGGPSPLRQLPSGRSGIWASLRLPAGSEAVRCFPGGMFAELRCHVGGANGQLQALRDGDALSPIEVRPDRWAEVVLDVRDSARIDLSFDGDGGELWLAGLRWLPRAAATAARSAVGGAYRFGHGWALRGAAPELTATTSGRSVVFTLRGQPADTGMIAMARACKPLCLSGAGSAEPAMLWVDDTTLIGTSPVTLDGNGHGQCTIELPTELPDGRFYAQAMIGANTADPRFSNGMLLQIEAQQR